MTRHDAQVVIDGAVMVGGMSYAIFDDLKRYAEVEGDLDECLSGGVIGKVFGIADVEKGGEFSGIDIDVSGDGRWGAEGVEDKVSVGLDEAVDNLLCFGVDGELDSGARGSGSLGANVIKLSVGVVEVDFQKVNEVDATEEEGQDESIAGGG